MSGLFGVVGFGGGVDLSVVELMGGAGLHRGPDGMGVWTGVEAGLGCLELWVAPESVGETGPWVAEDVVVAADVRLDNRSELIRSLGAAGGVSDRELLGLAYRRWGENCAERLLGDFAFVVYDRIRHRVFAARDVMGMRPLYYRSEPERFLFGSEVKQILAVPDVPVRIFEPAVAGYLAGGVTRLEWTFYEGINQLPPGHFLVVSDHGSRLRRYWEIDPENQIRYSREQDYADHFRELFIEAVRCRTRTDYPVGIFLSGGVDSGSIASTVGWLRERGEGPQDFRAYNWAFEQLPQCDERHLSRLITDHYQIPTTDIWADQAWPLKDYPKHGPTPDEPFIGVYQALIEQTLHTAQTHNTKLMLSGNRGDEMIGDWVFDFLGLLIAKGWGVFSSELAFWRDKAGLTWISLLRRYLVSSLVKKGRHALLDTLVGPAIVRREADRVSLPPWVATDIAHFGDVTEMYIERRLQQAPGVFDVRSQRASRIFMDAGYRIARLRDRERAKFGMEYADPWSDRRLAEFVLGIPQWVVQNPTHPKGIARDGLSSLFPTVRLSRKIEPVGLFHRGFRERSRPLIESMIQESHAEKLGMVDGEGLRGVLQNYWHDGTSRWDFWWPLTLEMWLRLHWDDRPDRPVL